MGCLYHIIGKKKLKDFSIVIVKFYDIFLTFKDSDIKLIHKKIINAINIFLSQI